MANTKGARKAARQAEKRRKHNASLRSALTSAIKSVTTAIAAGDKAGRGRFSAKPREYGSHRRQERRPQERGGAAQEPPCRATQGDAGVVPRQATRRKRGGSAAFFIGVPCAHPRFPATIRFLFCAPPHEKPVSRILIINDEPLVSQGNSSKG